MTMEDWRLLLKSSWAQPLTCSLPLNRMPDTHNLEIFNCNKEDLLKSITTLKYCIATHLKAAEWEKVIAVGDLMNYMWLQRRVEIMQDDSTTLSSRIITNVKIFCQGPQWFTWETCDGRSSLSMYQILNHHSNTLLGVSMRVSPEKKKKKNWSTEEESPVPKWTPQAGDSESKLRDANWGTVLISQHPDCEAVQLVVHSWNHRDGAMMCCNLKLHSQ